MELVRIRNKSAITTSRQVAMAFGKEHSKVLRAIENLGCSKFFTQANFGLSSYKDESGKQNKEYIITRDGFTLLAMGFTGKKAMEFKERYIEAFNQMEQMILNQSSKEWLETRKQGKLTRKSETDVIKDLVDYAKGQGSKNADMLYTVYSKLANKTVGVEGRDKASVMQLNNLSLIEHIILNVIKGGMAKNKHYKEIYQDSKLALQDFLKVSYLVAN